MGNVLPSKNLTVITDQKGPRLEYILDYILKELCGIEYILVYDIHQIPVGPCIYYCPLPSIENQIHIVPIGLLSENNIKPQKIEIGNWLGNTTLFANEKGNIPFDVFSASFYLISRYEEYLDHRKDKFGRYSHLDSIAFNNNFLHQPLVNIWAKELQKIIMAAFPAMQFSKRVSRFIPTYDIDIAWKYKHKGWIRTMGGLVKSIVNAPAAVSYRIKVILGLEKDPYDEYEWLDTFHLKNNLKPEYFFLIANKIKGKDKNVHPSKKAYQHLIAKQSLANYVGIHPSWQSGDSVKILQDEIATMEKITGKPVYKSRFHYLRFNLPNDYQKLIDLGIIEDYSMGYGTINGFRASVSTPFYWYNLKTETTTSLLIYPFCWMDATCYYQLKHTTKQAFEELSIFKKLVNQCNGDLIILSHNNFFSGENGLDEWKRSYELVVSGKL
jgi:hypothetical protein